MPETNDKPTVSAFGYPIGGSKDDGKFLMNFMAYMLMIYNSGGLTPFIEFVESPSRMLLYIYFRQKCHPSEISKALNLSRPNVASTLRVLENDGLIARETDKENRRQVFVVLTPKGVEEYNRRASKMVALFSAWFNVLSKEERENLFRIIVTTAAKIRDLQRKGKMPFQDILEMTEAK